MSAIASGLFSRAGTLWVTGSWYTADTGWNWLIREFCADNCIFSKLNTSQPFSEVLLHALQSLW